MSGDGRFDYHEYIAEDLAAHGISRWRWYMRLTRPQLLFQRLLRRAEYEGSQSAIWHRLRYVITRVRLARLSQKLGLSIPPGVFGKGLSIAHYGTIVVNDRARVGSYCRLHVGTTLGERDGRAPTIGDFVYVGPGAVIYGGVMVGDRAVIAANSVVGRDVPPDVTVGGAPARVLSDSNSRSVMPNAIQSKMDVTA